MLLSKKYLFFFSITKDIGNVVVPVMIVEGNIEESNGELTRVVKKVPTSNQSTNIAQTINLLNYQSL